VAVEIFHANLVEAADLFARAVEASEPEGVVENIYAACNRLLLEAYDTEDKFENAMGLIRKSLEESLKKRNKHIGDTNGSV
jgi:hypothetical protein